MEEKRLYLQHCLLEGKQASPVCPSGRVTWLRMSMESRWNDNQKGKLLYSEKNLYQCQFVHHKYHIVGSNPVLRGGRLSYGTVLKNKNSNCMQYFTSYLTEITVFPLRRPVDECCTVAQELFMSIIRNAPKGVGAPR